MHTAFKTQSASLSQPKPSNTVLELDNFYISYNSNDSLIYGDVTTAIVIGKMEYFYILNGDHRNQLAIYSLLGLQYCLNYFKQNLSQINKFSKIRPRK